MPRAYRPRGIPLVRHYVRKRTYSTSDRILIHLSTDALQPEEQTQTGIAAATLSARPTLTKWLDRLMQRGLVIRSRIRLPGHPLPRYAYRLSETGWRAVASLRQQLGSDLVVVRVPKAGELSVRMSEVPHLASARLDLTRALACVHMGRLDLARAGMAERGRGTRIWGNGLRRVDRFYGRKREFRDLDVWWASDTHALLITGLAGIGKSTLVATWAQDRRLGVPVYGFEVRRSSRSASLLSDLGAFLAVLGKPSLAAHLDEGVPLDSGFVARLLRRDLHGERLLIVLDNADQAPRALARLATDLFLQGSAQMPARVILLARRFPRWLTPSQRSTSLESRQIQGLDWEASRVLLRSRGLLPGAPSTEEIIRTTRGHPLLLHLAATTGASQGTVARRYLEEEVWESLRPKDRRALEAASIFRAAVSERVFEAVANADRRGLEALVERSLLETNVSGGYVMHDVIREFVAGRLSKALARRLHATAAKVLLESSDTRERWEGIYHLLAADKAAVAAALLDSDAAPLLDCVGAEEIVSLVRNINLDETEAGTYCVFAEVLGDSLRIRGHVAPALFQYGHARRLAESSGLTLRIPRLLRKMAFLERCRNRYPRALGLLTEAYARLMDHASATETIEVLREMALAEQALGSLEPAESHLNEAVDLATDAGDEAALSRTLLALASLKTQRGHAKEGLQSGLEGLRRAVRSGNLTEVAHAQIVVGALLTGVDRAADSLAHCERGFEVARLLGNLRLMAYATMNETSALLHLGRFSEAANRLREAKDVFGILEEKDTEAFLKTYEGELEMAIGHWPRAISAWKEGIRELRTHGTPGDLALVLRDVAGFYAKHGQLRESRTHLLEAKSIAGRIGNQDLLGKIESDLRLLKVTAGTNVLP